MTSRVAGRKTAACRSAAAAALFVLLAGCGALPRFTPDLAGYDLSESEAVRAAPWPRLVEVPPPPPPGHFTAAVPDPATGQALIVELGAEARRLRERMAAVSGPVLSEADRRRLTGG